MVDVDRVLFLAGGALIGTAMSWVGLRGLALRRPFMFRSVWLTSAIAAGVCSIVLPGVVESLRTWPVLGSGSALVMLGWPLLMLGMATLAIFRFRGLIGFGMTGDALRDALLVALRELEVEYTESLTAVELPKLPARLDVVVEGWMGTAQVHASDREGRRLLPKIARSMNRHFRSTRSPIVLLSCASYATFGGVLLGLVAFFALAA